MDDNIGRVLGLALSFVGFCIALSLLFYNVYSVDGLIGSYGKNKDVQNLLLKDTEENLITLEQAKALMGEILLQNFREKTTRQEIFIDGKKIKVTIDMKVPKLYIGSSNLSVDFNKKLPVLDKETYRLSYVYSDKLEIVAYRLE